MRLWGSAFLQAEEGYSSIDFRNKINWHRRYRFAAKVKDGA